MQKSAVGRQLLLMESKANQTSQNLGEWELPQLSRKQTPEQLWSTPVLMWESCFPAAQTWEVRQGRGRPSHHGPSSSSETYGECAEGYERDGPRRKNLTLFVTVFTPLEFTSTQGSGYQISAQNSDTFTYTRNMQLISEIKRHCHLH